MDNYAYAYNFLLNYNIHRVNSQLLIYKINCHTLKVNTLITIMQMKKQDTNSTLEAPS